MRKMMMTLAMVALVAVNATAMRGADATNGKTVFTPCTACHGMNGEGNKTLNAPKLAGQEIWYIERQLGNFKKGIRGTDTKDLFGMQMKPMALTLDDKGVKDVAAFLGGMAWVPAAKEVKGNVENGKKQFAVCVTCHGDKGQGNQTLNAPRIAGQEDWYLMRQVKNFASGIRGSHAQDLFGMQMRPMAQAVIPNQNDESGLRDLVAYINTLD